MRKFVIAAGVLALAACNGEAEVTEEEAPAEEEVVEVAGPVGDYTFTNDEGAEMAATIAADGTTQVMSADGEVVDSGTWELTEEGQTCFTMEGMEEGSDPTCVTFGEPAEDGTVEVTGSDGEVDTVTLVS